MLQFSRPVAADPVYPEIAAGLAKRYVLPVRSPDRYLRVVPERESRHRFALQFIDIDVCPAGGADRQCQPSPIRRKPGIRISAGGSDQRLQLSGTVEPHHWPSLSRPFTCQVYQRSVPGGCRGEIELATALKGRCSN